MPASQSGAAEGDTLAEAPRDSLAVYLLPSVDVLAPRPTFESAPSRTRVHVDRRELARFSPATAADAIAHIPGVELVKTGPWSARAALRGLSGDRVLVLVDGVRLNPVRGHGAEPSLVDFARVEAIEIAPGSDAARFGSSALAGAVNIVTEHPLFSPAPRLGLAPRLRASAPGSGWSTGLAARVTTARAGVEASGTLGGLAALHSAEGTVPNSSFRESHAALRAAGLWGDVILRAEASRALASDVGLPAFSNSAGASAAYPHTARSAWRLEAASPARERRPEVQVLVSGQTYDTLFRETTRDSVFLRGRLVATRANVTHDRPRSTGTETQISVIQPRWAGLALRAGFRREATGGPRLTEVTVYNREGRVTGADSTAGESIPPAHRTAWDAGAFVSPVRRGIRLDLGLRFDASRARVDSAAVARSAAAPVRDDERLSASMGFSRRLGSFEPYGSLATGFRTPNLDERFFNGYIHGALRVFGNPELRAERSLAAEVGVRASGLLSSRLRGRLSLYRSWVEDMISLLYHGQLYLVPRFQYVNLEEARLEGIEAEAELDLGPPRVRIAVALPRGIDRATGETLNDVGAPKVTADLALPVGRLHPGAKLALRYRWSAPLDARDELLRRPGYEVAAAEFSMPWRQTQVTLAVTNLFNADYAEPMSFIREPGRRVTLAVRSDFERALSRDHTRKGGPGRP